MVQLIVGYKAGCVVAGVGVPVLGDDAVAVGEVVGCDGSPVGP